MTHDDGSSVEKFLHLQKAENNQYINTNSEKKVLFTNGDVLYLPVYFSFHAGSGQC